MKLIVTQLGETTRRGKERICEQILKRATRDEGSLLLVFYEAHLLDGDAPTRTSRNHRGRLQFLAVLRMS